jgi:quercetin dioxygenase-like cupin family protein
MIAGPHACRLTPRLDVDRLRADLAALRAFPMGTEESYFRAPGERHVGWSVLSLRSQNGEAKETTSGGPGLTDFQDTPAMRAAPYLREVLEAIPGPKRSVRLSVLPPGGSIARHDDVVLSLEHGLVRLHAPIQTGPEVEFEVGGERIQMAPGELWYGDFTLPHAVENRGAGERVHLLIEVAVTPALRSIFPAGFWDARDVVTVEAPAPPAAPVEAYACRFTGPSLFARLLPKSWTSWQRFEGALAPRSGELVMSVNGAPAIALDPRGGDRFAFRGGPPCVVLEVERGEGGVRALKLRSRIRKEWYTIPLPLRSLDP